VSKRKLQEHLTLKEKYDIVTLSDIVVKYTSEQQRFQSLFEAGERRRRSMYRVTR